MADRGTGTNIPYPTLTPEDVETIRWALFNRGFSLEQIPTKNEPIDFSYVDLPDGACFDGFRFVGPTTFESARFVGPSLSFIDTRFFGETTFKDVDFWGEFDCTAMSFQDSLCFDGATFHRTASFDGSNFRGQSTFAGTKFLGTVTFLRCSFERSVEFSGTEFHNDVLFNEAKFHSSAHFQRADFRGTVPGFFEATFPEYIVWHKNKWPKVPKFTDQALDHIQSFQRLARMMGDLEKFDDQRMFEREEMRVRRRVDMWFPAGLMNQAYALISDYGYGLLRVILWWLGHIVLGAIVLFVAKIVAEDDSVTGWEGVREACVDFMFACALSFGNAHGPLGLNRSFFGDVVEDWPCYQVVGPVQTVLGVIILFFLLLTIRNRFRMR